MANQIRFEREMRARAKWQGTALFAVGCDTQFYRAALHTPALSDKEAGQLYGFCTRIASLNQSPKEAFLAVFGEG